MRVDHVFEQFGNIPDLDVDQIDETKAEAEQFPAPTNFDCLKHLVNFYEAKCAKLSGYDLQYVKYFVRECEKLDGLTGVEVVTKKLYKSC